MTVAVMRKAIQMANESYPADRIIVDWADSDALWGPLLFLRPKTTQYFGPGRVLLGAALVGGFQGMAVNLGMMGAYVLTGRDILPVYVAPLALTVVVAGVLHLTVRRAWNRRVERLLRTRAWIENTQR